MSAHKITIQQIADRLGVSKYTVSQALSGKEGISEATRRQVLETAKSMGYKQRRQVYDREAPQTGIASDAATSPYVIIWIPYRERGETEFWQRVLSGIVAGCDERNWEHIILSPYDYQGRLVVLPPYLDTSTCLGGLSIGSFPLTTIHAYVQTKLPVVLIDHDERFADLDAVVNNNLEAAHLLLTHMAESGCEKLIFVGQDHFSVSFRERWWGCKMGIEALTGTSGAKISLRKWSIPYSETDWLQVLSSMLDRLEPQDWPHGFIGANDHIAMELQALLVAKGIDIPAQCKVAGFDNIRSAGSASPPLTTVDLGKEELGIRAIEALEKRISHPDRPRERISLSPQLVVRLSC
ncbi:hypothetical protein SY83_07305 [Paenibacillus swuensis]|uniref:HTH lacI-type domain-containing protein n=1 Tax=Paenibacillus swuensis TaxID=1178515 RepID=A0A172TGW6_9BACL|nr:LacI family DNA-binding transcriptional regulator [Paenibacillus swuensis]ANE46117.1 hypothetical protein SY83_07305 [Paenibacillus swuensis]